MSPAVAALKRPKPDHHVLQRVGAKRQPVDHLGLPPWHGWRTQSEAKRIVRWIETVLVQPVGVGAGQKMRVAPFQRKLIAQLCESLATLVSIPAGNGKTTLMAAVGLERMCRGDEYVEVDVLATKEAQAGRLLETCVRMIECVPTLPPLFDFYRNDSVLLYKPTGSKMKAQPARLSAVQGLNSDLALIDEVGMVQPEFVTSMLARLGKKPGQRVVGFGTPGFDHENMLETIRAMSHAGELPAGVEFVEYAAEPGCAIDDEEQWRRANPAIDAGFLLAESLPLKAALMPEHEFRAYHLGQPVDASAPWLGYGAWDALHRQEPPRDGAQVVLGLWGNYRRQVAIVGATLDGGVFFGWQAEKAGDDELGDVIRRACEQWEVLELVHKPHIRYSLLEKIAGDGVNVVPFPSDVASDVASSAALYQAIAEGTLAHDGDELLAEQMGRLTAKIDRHGNPRLVESQEPDVSAAFAARAAWWRARSADPDDGYGPMVF